MPLLLNIYIAFKISYIMAKNFNLQMFLVLGAVILTTVIICFSAANCSGGEIKFEKTFYLVYYRMSDNTLSANSLSDAASSYGGAGYVIEFNENYYVTFSCYYSDKEAQAVCSNLKRRDLDCEILKIELKRFKLQNRNAKKHQKLYLGNLDTLYSLSALAYECANGLDTGEYSQERAKSILSSVTDTLNGLLKSNENNCFTASIKNLLDECEKAGSGYLLSKNMRYIQIALVDKILHAELT